MRQSYKLATAAILSAAALTGCATSELIDSGRSQTVTQKQVLLEDNVVAFGRPAASAGLGASSVVIVGEKHSYVLTEGGVQLVNLITHLDAKHISLRKNLDFVSPTNDGNFAGTMQLGYTKLKDEIKRSDLQFVVQNNGKECSTASDERIGAQRFCFDIPLKGGVYPQVSNYDLVRSQFSALSRPYGVSIYAESATTATKGRNSAEKLVLLPFALAFDVVTFPLQLLRGFD